MIDLTILRWSDRENGFVQRMMRVNQWNITTWYEDTLLHGEELVITRFNISGTPDWFISDMEYNEFTDFLNSLRRPSLNEISTVNEGTISNTTEPERWNS
jgi:hypothetical protein